MPNPDIADAILDRISNVALRIELKGDSLRKKRFLSLTSPLYLRHGKGRRCAPIKNGRTR